MKKIIVAMFILLPSLIFAQLEKPLITDRPDQTESALVVPVNSFQIETGFAYESSTYTNGSIDYKSEYISIAGTLLRYGINSFMEFRAGLQFSIQQLDAGGTETSQQGINGLMIGSKIQLSSEDNSFFGSAVLMEFALPYGNEALRPEKFQPTLKLAIAKSFSSSVSFGANAGMQENLFTEKSNYLYSGSLGISASERIGLFAEFYGQSKKNLSPQNYLHCGFTYLHKKNIQIDFSLAKRLSSDMNEVRGSVGFSVRLQ